MTAPSRITSAPDEHCSRRRRPHEGGAEAARRPQGCPCRWRSPPPRPLSEDQRCRPSDERPDRQPAPQGLADRRDLSGPGWPRSATFDERDRDLIRQVHLGGIQVRTAHRAATTSASKASASGYDAPDPCACTEDDGFESRVTFLWGPLLQGMARAPGPSRWPWGSDSTATVRTTRGRA